MHRLILLAATLAATLAALALATPAAAETPAEPPLHLSNAFACAGPKRAAGAVVWLHGSYDKDNDPPADGKPAG